jgi:O-antigen/teichoic acid export membrane protein
VDNLPSARSHMPSANQTLRNVTFIWGNRLLLALVPLIITPLLVNHFGLAVTGVWLLTTQLAAQLTLLDSGIVTSVTRLLARTNVVDSGAQPERIVSTTFWMLVAIGSSLITCAPLIANFFVATFSIPDEVVQDSWWLVVLTVAFVSVSLPLRSGYGLLGSKHRFDTAQVFDAIPIFLRLVLVVSFVFFGQLTLLGLGLIVYLSNLLGLFFVFRAGLRLYSGLKSLSVKRISVNLVRPILTLSASALIITLSSLILIQGSPMLIGYHLEVRSVSLLTIPLFIFMSITPFFATFAAIISPIAAGTTTNAEFAELRSFYTTTNAYLASAAFAAFLINYVLGDLLFQLWLGGEAVSDNDTREMSRILSILLVSFALSTSASMGRAILCSIGRHWRAAMIDLITSLFGLAVGIMLVIRLDMGVFGSTLGIAVAFTLRGLLTVQMVADTLRVSLGRQVSSFMMRPVLITSITIFAGESIRRFTQTVESVDPVATFSVWALPALAWLYLTWRFVVIADHRFKVRSVLRHSPK